MTLYAQLVGAAGAHTLDVAFDTKHGPLVIVGPNGSGKTTLLLMLLGARRPRAGRIAIHNEVLFDSAARIDVPLEARGIGYVPQSYALFGHMTVRENVEFALATQRPRLSRAVLCEHATALLAELDVAPLAARRADELSGGERQKVALARALAARPRALLLDEPLAALDIGARREVRELLCTYLTRLALPCVLVMHDAQDARTLGTHIAVLEAGRITQCGTWAQLVAEPSSAFVRELVRE